MTRIIAAALCCLPLTACGSIADRLSEYERDRQYDTLQDILTHTEHQK